MADDHRSLSFDDTALVDTPAGVLDSAKALAIGSRFADRYRVEALLGVGGMGAVYRVHDERLDEPVALKLMTLAAGNGLERFIDEVRLARRVTHPNVTRTHDIGEHDGRLYLTMQHVEGETLEALLEREGALPPARAAAIGAQIAAGLEAAHASGVIHRDLKPSNVLVDREGRAVITDFGIARAARGESAATTGIIGTPAYMSPEQACGAPVDARSDLYALGIILYELLSTRLPFEETGAMASALARLRRAPTDLRQRVATPAPLAALVMSLLARDPEDRPSAARVVWAELDTFATGARPLAPAESARLSPGERTLAVLPFRYRGAAEHDYLGAGLAEELIDALSRTRGLKVLALGAVARFADERDPLRVGTEVGADTVVDGNVHLASERLRVAVRMHDARQGTQLWSERLDIAARDVFTIEETLSQRIAETLRLELDARPVDRHVPSEAIELYLRGRRILRRGVAHEAEEALALFEESLALAPSFQPVLSAHAIASARAWWLATASEAEMKEARVRESVGRAEDRAADQAETHLARAMLSVHLGAYGDAARALARALAIAPTMAEAHQLLGVLEGEAGRAQQAIARLCLALELDPTLHLSRMSLWRLLAYEGEMEAAERLLHELVEALGERQPGVFVCRTRWAMLRRDEAEIARVVGTIEQSTSGFSRLMSRFFLLLTGKAQLSDALDTAAETDRHFQNLRFYAVTGQVRTEIYAYVGAHQAALDELARLGDSILIDTVWLDRCPHLAPLRSHPKFLEAAAKVRERASRVWTP